MTYQPWKTQMAALSSKIDLDELCKLLGIVPFDSTDASYSETYHLAQQSAMDSGSTEDEAEIAGIAAEQAEQDYHYTQFRDAVETTAKRFFLLHKLDIQKMKDGRFSITPSDSWEAAAGALRDTINGVGMFYFRSTREFMDSGPYTARQAVLSHLHHIPSWSDVYGEAKPRSVFSRLIQN